MSNDEDPQDMAGEYASPPCFMHELTPDYRVAPAGQQYSGGSDVARWRRAERRRLIDARLMLDPDERNCRSERIVSRLEAALCKSSGRLLAAYWPVRGEPDLRNWMIRNIERGSRIALPIVVAGNRPLEFRLWSPGDPLERGLWDMLVPARGTAVQPDVIIAPGVGFDEAGHRLGYGGGLLDRTLAAMPRKPQVIGVGFAESRIRTIYPQPLDVPMDLVVTDG